MKNGDDPLQLRWSWFIHQTSVPVSLELKDTEVRAYRTDPVQFQCILFLIAYYLKLKMMFAVANRVTFDEVFYVDYEKFKGNIF
ncbi:hypothetical protein VNO80_03065 [Phaseolus coccineus]|uniref:Uncharacterized protein n=1 Tax=Phaseolus coccineus TaxID=3886 RepID=A0AAN9NRD0_PHACN